VSPTKATAISSSRFTGRQTGSSRRAASTWLWVQLGSDAFAGLSTLSLTVTAGFNDFLSKEVLCEFIL
jgi:hypothetical protein